MATILGILACVLFLLSFQLKTRKNIILVNLLSRVLFILQYIFLGAFAGAAFDFIGFISSVIARHKENKFVSKHLVAIIVIINAVLVATGILLYKNIFSLFGLAGIILEVVALWLTKERDIRIVSFLSAPFWLTYNIASRAYASAPGNILAMVSIGIAMARLDFPKKNAKKDGGKLVLASKSPRRRELLSLYTTDFEIDVSGADEPAFSGGSVAEYVKSLAAIKAREVALRHPGATIIGADTVVAFGGEVLGKPRSSEHATEMLTSMSGGAQQVYTGVCVIRDGREICDSVCTEVVFRELSAKEIADYVATGDCMDKAGAYGIQGGAGEFVASVKGDYFNVIGLPMKRLTEILEG